MNTQIALNRAFHYTANQQYSDAATIFDVLFDESNLFDCATLQQMIECYRKVKKYDKMQSCLKLYLTQRIDEDHLSHWLKILDGYSLEVNELSWLLTQEEIHNYPTQLLYVVRRLNILGEVQQAYFLAVDILNRIEPHFEKNQHRQPLYVQAVLTMLELEFEQGSYTQLRFHLRKLLFLKQDMTKWADELAKWTIISDDYDSYFQCDQFEGLLKSCEINLQNIIKLHYLMKFKQTSEQGIKALEESSFKTPILKAKASANLCLMKQLCDQPIDIAVINKLYEEFPDDLLINILFIKLHKKTVPTDIWDNFLSKHADHPEALQAYISNNPRNEPKRTKVDCDVTFLGGGQRIGGTGILLSVNGHHVLLDAGMHVNDEDILTDFNLLTEKGLSLQDLDAVIVSHAHIDHTGSLPYFYKQAPKVPIYMTEITASFMRLLLQDTAKYIDSSIYTERDVEAVYAASIRKSINEQFVIESGEFQWKITFFEAGHILGAAAIYIECEDIKILFTGDFSVESQHSCGTLQLPPNLQIDVLITESTYGYTPNNQRIPRQQQEEALVKAIEQTTQKNGVFLLPAFALGRSQEILYLIHEYYRNQNQKPPFTIVVDGRVSDMCNIYDTYYPNRPSLLNNALIGKDFYGKNGFTFDQFYTMYIDNQPGGTCVIASSGMLNEGSTSSRYAKPVLQNIKNTVAFTGYVDAQTLGARVLQQQYQYYKEIIIDETRFDIHAAIETYKLSAHVNREDLLKMILMYQPQQLFLMHGEHEKRYKSIQATVKGEVIYPSIVELLQLSQQPVICAMNGETYPLLKEECKK